MNHAESVGVFTFLLVEYVISFILEPLNLTTFRIRIHNN